MIRLIFPGISRNNTLFFLREQWGQILESDLRLEKNHLPMSIYDNKCWLIQKTLYLQSLARNKRCYVLTSHFVFLGCFYTVRAQIEWIL